MQERTKITVFDTTLRDGEQSPGCSMNGKEKLRMARQLDRLGVDVMEVGFPVASQGDFEAVQRIAQEIRKPVIAALARCCPGDVERAWQAVQGSARPRIHTFLATSDLHLKDKLKISRLECVEQACGAVRLARSLCDDVEFSAEDATRSDFGFLCQVIEAVIEAGATTINIPDTVGYAVPSGFAELICRIRTCVPGVERVILSAHCHNDLGLAVANSLAAIEAGVRQVECTINGIGERAGNASLEEIVMAMRVRGDHYAFDSAIVSEQLFPCSQLLSEITGVGVQPNKAITGRNAFAHEAGIHQDGMIKNRQTYEIMTPQSVGVPDSRLVLGKHSGRHALGLRCEKLGFPMERRELDELYRRFVVLADEVKTVEDHHLLELLRKIPSTVANANESPGQLSSPAGRDTPILPDRFPPPNFTNRTVGRDSILLSSATEHEGEQEDYLWGV